MCGNFSVTIRRDGRVVVLALAGDLDCTAAPGLCTHMAAVRGSGAERLVLDLADVQFLDCAGARVITRACHEQDARCPVIVRSPSPAVRRLFEILDPSPKTLAGRDVGSWRAAGRSPADASHRLLAWLPSVAPHV
jgi:anti-anti-sigma factor